MRCLKNALNFAIIDGRNDGSDHHLGRHTGGTELLYGIEPPPGSGCSGLHFPGDAAIQRRNGQRDFDKATLRHPGKDVYVANDESRLRDDADAGG